MKSECHVHVRENVVVMIKRYPGCQWSERGSRWGRREPAGRGPSGVGTPGGRKSRRGWEPGRSQGIAKENTHGVPINVGES